jgi:hypothetical protein
MKKKRKKKHKNKEPLEAHIFPSHLSKEEQKRVEEQISDFRQVRSKNTTDEDRYLSRVLHLKYMIEDYLRSNDYNKKYTFSYFLREYILSLNKKNTEFSKEICLHVTQLSRLLNNRDEPNKKILFRLEIHSNNWIPALYWYKIIVKQKELNIINEKSLRISERKKVKR